MTDKEIIKAEIERRILDWRMGMSAEEKYRLEAYTELLEVVNTLPKEPASEELETSIMEYMNHVPENDPELSTTLYTYEQMQAIARHFAKWQKEQFENNRLKHCNSITNEQAKLEQEFVDQHLDKHQRMPTFLDAIEYGAKWKEQQMMKEAVDGLVVCDELTHGYKDIAMHIPDNLEVGDKVKLIIIKED